MHLVHMFSWHEVQVGCRQLFYIAHPYYTGVKPDMHDVQIWGVEQCSQLRGHWDQAILNSIKSKAVQMGFISLTLLFNDITLTTHQKNHKTSINLQWNLDKNSLISIHLYKFTLEIIIYFWMKLILQKTKSSNLI